MTTKKFTATRRFTPEAIEEAVMAEARRLIATGEDRDAAVNLMIAGFKTAEFLRTLAATPTLVPTLVAT